MSTPSMDTINIEVLNPYGNTLDSLQISNASPQAYMVGTNNSSRVMTQHWETGAPLENKGYIFRSDDFFYCNYRVIAHPQSGSITCKGRSAVGYRFRPGHMINSQHYSTRSNSVSIMALEDADIKISNLPDDLLLENIQIEDGGLEFSLNRGETIVLTEYLNITRPNNIMGFMGSLVESTGEIVVNSGSYTGGNVPNFDARDIGFDQIIPMHMAGKEFICIRGNGYDLMENVIVIIDKNNTELSVNGILLGTYAAGEYVVLPESYFSDNDNMYVNASQPVVLYQMIGGFTHYPTYGMNFIPALNCLTDTIVNNIPFYNRIGGFGYNGYIIITARRNAEVRKNGVLLPTSSAKLVPGNPKYVTYKLLDDKSSNHLRVESEEEIQVGLVGANGLVGFAAYFSGFTEPPHVRLEGSQLSGGRCFDLLRSYGNYQRVEWYFNDSLTALNVDSFFSRGVGEYKALAYFEGCDYKDSVEITHPASDTVYVETGSCSVQDTGLFVFRDISSRHCDSITIKKVHALRSDFIELNNYTCQFPDQATDTLYYTNSEGCDSIHVMNQIYVGLDTVMQQSEICAGESLEFEGDLLDESGLFCKDYISFFGCDSTRCVELKVVPNYRELKRDTICWNEILVYEGDTLESPGKYSWSYSGVVHCDSTIELILEGTNDPQPVLEGPANYCLGDSTEIRLNYPSSFDLQWSDGNSDDLRYFHREDTLSFLLSDAYGCSQSFQIVIPKPIEVAAEIEAISNCNQYQISCFEASDGWVELSATGGDEPYEFIWPDSTSGSNRTDLGPGNYSIIARDNLGCLDTIHIAMNEPEELGIQLQSIDIDCLNDWGSIIVEDITGGIAPYELSFEGALYNSGRITHLEEGAYELVLVDQNGCSLEKRVQITDTRDSLYLNIVCDSLVELGEEISLTYQSSQFLVDLYWSASDSSYCQNCLRWEFTPLENLEIELWGIDARGCENLSRTSVTVYNPRAVYIPNSFSPNDDGSNDLFTVFATPSVRRVKSYRIFNRWGGMIYEAFDLKPNVDNAYWDGTQNGRPMNPGVFVYKIEVEYINGEREMFSGDVSLFR